MIEAKSLTTNKNGLTSITDPVEVKAGLDGLLTLNGKKILVIRGNDCNQTVGYIFTALANGVDRTGSKFRFSRKLRGLTEIDPVYHNVIKVSCTSMQKYIREFFALAELLNTSVGRVLILVSDLPKMASQLWIQTRFISAVAPMFEMID